MLTVFLGTFNRLESLIRTVRSYEHFTTPLELVVVDNGTDNYRCLSMLGRLEQHPLVRKVYSMPKSQDMDGLTKNFLTAIHDQKTTRNDMDWIAVSEADICFDGTPPDTLERYVELAVATGQAVGCHLRVTDVPRGYPLRSRVMTTESRLLYKRGMNWHRDIPYSTWQIDTTFHLFPAYRDFIRLRMNPWRVGPPYDAMHLDWYLDIDHPTSENEIYVRKDEGQQVGSWGKNWIAGFWQMYQAWGPEVAFEESIREPRDIYDLCTNSFLLSWCYQYGVGTKVDREQSERWLRNAIPHKFLDYWAADRGMFGGDQDAMWSDWLGFVYRNDFDPLGWGRLRMDWTPYKSVGAPPDLLARLEEVGVMPQYGLEEVSLVYNTVRTLRPEIIVEWGTNVGYSARLFYEVVWDLGMNTRVHSVEIGRESVAGSIVKDVGVVRHIGDGVTIATALCKDRDRPLLFLDDSHEYEKVLAQLHTIRKKIPGAVVLMHDVLKVETVDGKTEWVRHEPGLAVDHFLAHTYEDYEVVFVTNGASMLRLWP